MLEFLLPLSSISDSLHVPLNPEIVISQAVRPLPNHLDHVPVFNSNSPELVLNEGILVSTFSPIGKIHPNAHLDYAFQGRFDIFAHHVAKADPPEDLRSLYLGIILYNPSNSPINVQVLQGSTYLSQPDAPFIELPAQVEATDRDIYAGPGSRVMGDILKDRLSADIPAQFTIPPQSNYILLNLPIPVRDLEPPLNGRSTYLRLHSDGQLYVASLAKFANQTEKGQEIAPSPQQWQELLQTGDLVTPRDRTPSPPNTGSQLIYGRVAGVSQGSQWNARLTDRGKLDLTIPPQGESISYGISTLVGGRLGTNQVQSAPLLVRYPDTAYEAHGNYGVEYRLTLPLFNPTLETQTVVLKLQTPVKEDKLTNGLQFLDPPSTQVFFRGLVKLEYPDEAGMIQTRYHHLVQHRGQRGEPLLRLTLEPSDRKIVQVSLIYPPDATPPQILTLETLNE